MYYNVTKLKKRILINFFLIMFYDMYTKPQIHKEGHIMIYCIQNIELKLLFLYTSVKSV
jgi:hypothetical protein